MFRGGNLSRQASLPQWDTLEGMHCLNNITNPHESHEHSSSTETPASEDNSSSSETETNADLIDELQSRSSPSNSVARLTPTSPHRLGPSRTQPILSYRGPSVASVSRIPSISYIQGRNPIHQPAIYVQPENNAVASTSASATRPSNPGPVKRKESSKDSHRSQSASALTGYFYAPLIGTNTYEQRISFGSRLALSSAGGPEHSPPSSSTVNVNTGPRRELSGDAPPSSNFKVS